MIDNLLLIVFALVVALPVVNLAMRMCCDIYFAKKMEYQKNLIHDLQRGEQ